MNRMPWKSVLRLVVPVGLLAVGLACIISPVAWSPDGKWVAFVHYWEDPQNKDKGATQLWMVSPSPVQKRLLVETSGTILSAPTWAADGQSLYVAEYESKENTTGPKAVNLFNVSIEGAKRTLYQTTTLAEPGPAFLTAPAVTPDGRIAFPRDEKTVLVVKGKAVEREIETTEAIRLGWSPDGRALAVTTSQEGKEPAIRFLDMQSTRALSLPAAYGTFAWKPDGKQIVAFKSTSEGGAEKCFVAILDPAAEFKEIKSFPVPFKLEGPAVLAPSGNAVYFYREDAPNDLKALCRMNLGSGKVDMIYQSTNSVCPSAVSPDNRKLAFRESAPGEDGDDSFVGVLTVEPTVGQPLFLAVDEGQMADVIKNSLKELQDVLVNGIEASEQAVAKVRLANLERYVESFRQMFPKSAQNAQFRTSLKNVREAVEGTAKTAPAGSKP